MEGGGRGRVNGGRGEVIVGGCSLSWVEGHHWLWALAIHWWKVIVSVVACHLSIRDCHCGWVRGSCCHWCCHVFIVVVVVFAVIVVMFILVGVTLVVIVLVVVIDVLVVIVDALMVIVDVLMVVVDTLVVVMMSWWWSLPWLW